MGEFVIFILLASIVKLCSSYGYSQVPYSSGFFPIVTTDTGAIHGKLIEADGTQISAFLGIPYAEPPVGEQRFKIAVPKQSWHGVYDATKKPLPCMQYSSKHFPWLSKSAPSEDCLYLNVWVPGKLNFPFSDPFGRPVLLWIHGGGYFSGSSEIDLYDGAILAAQGNVIVVSINYRVGAFGFLTAGTNDVPGNMGMFDQVLAMEWVRNNIRQFGGDPDKITLIGQSAGSISVGLHLISPQSRNLFRRAIMMSGSPYHPILTGNSSTMMYGSNVFAAAVGCANDSVNMFTDQKKVVDCLRKMDALQLAIAESVILQKIPYFFVPIQGDDFMPVNPMVAMEKGCFKHTEVLLGTTSDEGSLFLNYVLPDVFPSEFASNVSVEQAKLFIFGFFQNSTNPPPQVVTEFYLKNAKDSDPSAVRKAIYDSFGDFIIHCPAVFFAAKFAKAGNTFFYDFTHKPSNSVWGDWMGVTHFEDVPFIFGDPIRNASAYTAEERLFSRTVIQKWVTFARSGVPILSKNEGWPLFTKENAKYLELNPRKQKVHEGIPHAEACDFWKSYFA